MANSIEPKRYVNHFDDYSTTYEVWDDHHTDRTDGLWKRRCIINFNSLPYIYIILPYPTDLEPSLFRQHLLHLESTIRKKELYYFDHNASTIRFCTAIGHNIFTPTIEMKVSDYIIHSDMNKMGFDFHMKFMNQYAKMYELLPSIVSNLLHSMKY